MSEPGALVISLDFELHWGVRDTVRPGSRRYAMLSGIGAVVGRLLDEFSARGVKATWATVGFLFASTREEIEAFSPTLRPVYSRKELDPYREEKGVDEDADPAHFAGSLVRQIASTVGQEVGSHTFSHYYCLEVGNNEETFRADLRAARAIAEARGIALHSLVFPRNQWNPAYLPVVEQEGFCCVRAPQPSWGHVAPSSNRSYALRRVARAIDSYGGVGPPPTTPWSVLKASVQSTRLCVVPASAFLRPYNPLLRRFDPLRRARLVAGLRDAARRARVFHLWWHPENFLSDQKQNFDFLRRLLDEAGALGESDGLVSMSMGEVAQRAIEMTEAP